MHKFRIIRLLKSEAGIKHGVSEFTQNSVGTCPAILPRFSASYLELLKPCLCNAMYNTQCSKLLHAFTFMFSRCQISLDLPHLNLSG